MYANNSIGRRRPKGWSDRRKQFQRRLTISTPSAAKEIKPQREDSTNSKD